MMTYAANFWLLFWLIIGGGAVLTVLATLLVALYSPTWSGRRQQSAPGHRHVREIPAADLPKAA